MELDCKPNLVQNTHAVGGDGTTLLVSLRGYRQNFLSLTLYRFVTCVMFLLLYALPISFLWLNISNILLRLHQDPCITNLAHTYLIFSLPELLINSFLHLFCIYLRVQGVTHPVTLASLLGTLLHFSFNYVIITHLGHRIANIVATSNFSILLFLLLQVSPPYAAPPTTASPVGSHYCASSCPTAFRSATSEGGLRS
ncbi:hypothetical protein Fmac_001410 [Flemingia macrophylla]|uniref:Protein RFT1 homolog n=1 Tax=Flemingia macrophylla TaxID=520843 RepID=A0ABD1NH15_9FABA